MSLLAVVEKGDTTAAEVADRIHLSPSTLVGNMDRLDQKGLIERDRNAEDRREVLIRATDRGRALAARPPFPLQYSLDKTLKQLSERERDQIALCMERLVDLMGAREIEAAPMLEIVAVRKRRGRIARGR
jgi:DNA-binding MarR family transcriptional regulator